MPELDVQLRALAADVRWPATPDLAARLEHAAPAPAPAPAARRLRRKRALAAVAATLVLLPTAGAAAFPGARDDVLGWLGLRNVEVRRVPAPPAGTRAELEADLGPRTTLGRASRDAGFAAAIPSALGPPDRVRRTGQRISLVYGPRPGLPALKGVDAGLILTESRGGIRGTYLQKLLLGGTTVERVRVHGRRGAFISGGDHAYLYETPDGEVRQDRALLAGPTLIWVAGGRVHRLETAASRATALRVARSVRP